MSMGSLPLWTQSMFWGTLAGCALLIGSFIGYRFNLKQRTVAGIMAFGSGVLISALSFELIDEAFKSSGIFEVILGLFLGAGVFTLANFILGRMGARNRKRSSVPQNEGPDNSLGIALGALIDGIPESIVIGVGLIEGSTLSMITIIAIFISNIPEGLSSTVGMKKRGRSLSYIIGIWGGMTILSGIFAAMGNIVFQSSSPEIIAIIMCFAAGGILAMIIDTMIPEAFADTLNFTGLIATLGFMAAFILEKL